MKVQPDQQPYGQTLKRALTILGKRPRDSENRLAGTCWLAIVAKGSLYTQTNGLHLLACFFSSSHSSSGLSKI